MNCSDKSMIDFPDELILLLLEKIDDVNSLLRCRKACRLLYRISLDRLLLSANFNTISNNGELLLVEEVINNSELFTTVVKDGRWRQLIDSLVRRQFRLFEKLMPDNEVQSLLTVIVIDNIAWSAAWKAARSAARDAAWEAAWNAARHSAWNAARHSAWNASWSAARNAARNATLDSCDAAWDAAQNVVVIDTIKNIITGKSSPTTLGERAWYVAEYLYLIKMIHDDIWQNVYHCFDGVELPEKIPPFWASPDLQGNVHAMEYKRLLHERSGK
jgi:hypothetical protein